MNAALGLCRGDIISVIGAGGKTTLIYQLAHELKGRVLIATTTRMYFPPSGICNRIFISTDPEPVQEGIYFLSGPSVNGKASVYAGLRRILNRFDYVLIEADGARGKLLKGWAAYEPVVINETTKTIGVLNLSLIGKCASHRNIHRLNEFMRITGAKVGDIITPEHIWALPAEMFRKAHGKKLLYLVSDSGKGGFLCVR